jgi:predicted GNAT superfamily acetyltransferase
LTMHTYTLLNPDAPAWPTQIDGLYEALGQPNPSLLPAYFVKTSFARMGGQVLQITGQDGLCGMGLLFPQAIVDGQPHYTLRIQATPAAPLDGPAVAAVAEALLAPAKVQMIYWPSEPQQYAPSHEIVGEFDIGAPDQHEAEAICLLHQTIWQTTPEARFPADIHSCGFGLGTSLVARHSGRVVGFLFGFISFGLPAALGRPGPSIESQTMGIDPAYRRYGLAALLKRRQAQQALERGFSVIHWTADPLQFPNAGLNFGRLRAVAGAFYPNYYPFRNALNRIHPSRLGITWLLDSAHGKQGLKDGAGRRELSEFVGAVLLNQGPEILSGPHDSAPAAIEIPRDWTSLQHDDEPLAQRWRDTTDSLLSAIVGTQAGRYLVTDVATQGERCYLIAQPFAPELIT